jgi:hypothetical protein
MREPWVERLYSKMVSVDSYRFVTNHGTYDVPRRSVVKMLIRRVCLLPLCGWAVAQSPNVQVSVVSTLTANTGYSTTQGVGPSPGGFSVSSTGQASSASMNLAPTSTSAYASGYQFTASASANYTFSVAGFAQCSGSFELLLTRPSSTPVEVAIYGSSVGLGGASMTQVDINADGSTEAMISNAGSYGVGTYSLVVGPTGTRIRVTHSSSALPTFASPYALSSTNLQMTFTSGPASLDSYGSGCFSLNGDITQAGDLHLDFPAASGSLAILALGTTAMSVPLSFTPGCLLLLQPLVTITGAPSGGSASFTFPGAAPPPGVSLHLQAAMLDPAGVFTTSNGLTLIGL